MHPDIIAHLFTVLLDIRDIQKEMYLLHRGADKQRFAHIDRGANAPDHEYLIDCKAWVKNNPRRTGSILDLFLSDTE